jgi:hypothetical protein
LARLSAVEPGYEGTNLGAALVAAADRLNESTAGRSVSRKEVIVISDFQVGARLDALQTQEWPREVAVRVEAVAAAGPTNAGLQLVSAGDLAGRGEIGALRVRVSNSPESKREEFQVGWAGSEGTLIGTAVTAYVPPGQSRIVRLPAAPAASAAARVVLRGDDDDFDNTLHVIPPVRRTVRVLWFGREGLEDRDQEPGFLPAGVE